MGQIKMKLTHWYVIQLAGSTDTLRDTILQSGTDDTANTSRVLHSYWCNVHETGLDHLGPDCHAVLPR